MTKHLIVNADDYGISEGVSQGILEAHLKGIVTSTTVMINMPNAAQAIPEAQTKAPNLGLGLHFVLSFGAPVSSPEQIPSLVTEDGNFVSTIDDLKQKAPTFTTNDLVTELTAQFERFITIAGTKPDHLDSHHDVTYRYPAAYEVMLTIAQQHNLPYRCPPWLGNPDDFDTAFINSIDSLHRQYGQPSHPDYRMNATSFWDRRSRVNPLRHAIANLQDGCTELLCHVGYGTGLEELYNLQREDELVAFTHPEIIAMVKQNPAFNLIRFSDLRAANTDH